MALLSAAGPLRLTGVVMAGGVKRRAVGQALRVNRWTEARKARFIEALSATLNISASARAVGMSTVSARALRKRDAAFDAAWDEALLVAYEELELATIRRATRGTVKPILHNGAKVGSQRDFSEKLVAQLMAQHNDRVMALRRAEGAEPGSDPDAGARARLIAKFESMEVRLRGDDDAA